jgi:hypothetical protein
VSNIQQQQKNFMVKRVGLNICFFRVLQVAFKKHIWSHWWHFSKKNSVSQNTRVLSGHTDDNFLKKIQSLKTLYVVSEFLPVRVSQRCLGDEIVWKMAEGGI